MSDYLKKFCKEMGEIAGAGVGLLGGTVAAGASVFTGDDPKKAFKNTVNECAKIGENIGENYGTHIVIGVGARVTARAISNAIDNRNT